MILPEEMSEIRVLGKTEESSVLLVSHPQMLGQCALKIRRGLDLERWANAARIHHLLRKDPRFQGVLLATDQWMLLEYIEGVCLREYHQHREFVSWEDFRSVALQVTEAVARLHQLGIIHKDLKPENIIHRLDGGIAIIDFGAAFFEKRATKLGEVGPLTERYASQAQKEGLPPNPDFDVHQLGVMFKELSADLLVPEGVAEVFDQCDSMAPPPLGMLLKVLAPGKRQRPRLTLKTAFAFAIAILAVLALLRLSNVLKPPVVSANPNLEKPVASGNEFGLEPPHIVTETLAKQPTESPQPEVTSRQQRRPVPRPSTSNNKDELMIPELYQ